MLKTIFETPIGSCGLAWEASSLTAFHLPDTEDHAARSPDAERIPDWIDGIITRVRHHLHGDWQDFSDLPYDFAHVGTFPEQVYRETLRIRPGATRSYGDIARALKRQPGASRAVGMALGANPWPLLIPCHRVVATNGKMTGFSGPGGIKTKVRLLAIEGAQLFDL